ncbi:PREDICTED: tripartite motif-containing protein 2-like [Branchiostoma belcheri]|uniref:Tripartite motif-containing protein 2-like n=1 Tax=Branchiostoma belcheri TaxID=7741 RepID=A0A6P4YEI3_BRABE|nr:PREDICTED: tripartite motif-containing protein 2-like [Branchiostoma belcheri]
MAAARKYSRSGSLEFIQEELSCGICHELLTRPKVVPCAGKHSFCQHCLERWASTQQPFRCPTCRQPSHLPAAGVSCLPDCDRRIVNLCDQLRSQGVSEAFELDFRCGLHDYEEFRVFCKQCQVPVCEACLEGPHDGHPTTTLKKASQERTPAVQALVNQGRAILEKYGKVVQGFRATEELLSKQKQDTETNISAAFDRIIQKLVKAKEGLLSQVDDIHKRNVDAIQDQLSGVLAEVSELSKVCENADEDITLGGNNLLQHEALLTSMVGKYRDKQAPTPKQPQVAVFNPTDDNVDTTSIVGYIFSQSFSIPSFAIPEPPASHDEEVFDRNHGDLRQVPSRSVTFGGKGAEEGKFDRPRGVAVSDEGVIFVADYINARVQGFTMEGEFVSAFLTVTSDGRKVFPYDVAIDREGNLWVVGHTESQSDYYAVQLSREQASSDLWQFEGELQVFTPEGVLLRTVGRQQGMEYPQYTSVDLQGNILVSDFKDHYVYKYNQSEQLLVKFGGEGQSDGQLKNPCGLCSDGSGNNIIVADSGNSRVEIFDGNGAFLGHVATGMAKPCAVAMATQGQLIVTDSEDHTVTVIQDVLGSE